MKKVLVADDFSVDLMLIRMAIESRSAQYRVVSVRDGEEAYRLLKESDFDLLPLDIKMPLLNGFELMERLHAEGCKLTPTIIVSGYGMAAHRARALALRADDFIHKAVDYGASRHELPTALSRHGLS